MKIMEVEHITFYQSVKIGKREYNTVHEESKETDLLGIKCVFLPELNLMRVTGGALKRDIYIGMANVRRFECDKLTAGVLGFVTEADTKVLVNTGVPPKETESLATKSVDDMTPEDEKIILTQTIKSMGGKTPHPMTGVKKLKETIKLLEKAKGKK